MGAPAAIPELSRRTTPTATFTLAFPCYVIPWQFEWQETTPWPLLPRTKCSQTSTKSPTPATYLENAKRERRCASTNLNPISQKDACRWPLLRRSEAICKANSKEQLGIAT